jgi:DNA-binding LacI/PurR family transcriptional regulator
VGSELPLTGRVPVTIVDVAAHAGVAPSTVSYALSGKRAISAGTRQRVLASIRTLGYRPHEAARALARSRSGVLALVLPLRAGANVPVLMRFAVAVVTSARRHEYDVLLVTADDGPDGLRRIATRSMVDGLVLMDVELNDPRISRVRGMDRPAVMVGFPAEPTGLTCVDLDYHRAGGLCAEHLADLGHTEVAFLGAPRAVFGRGTSHARRGTAGFLEAGAARGLSATAGPCEENPSAVRHEVARLLAERPGLTGLVVHNETAVPHVLAALRGLSLRVPRDVSVVAICPDDVAALATPALTNVQVPAQEIGARAVELLIGKLAGGRVPDGTLLEPRLTVRRSTAAPAYATSSA